MDTDSLMFGIETKSIHNDFSGNKYLILVIILHQIISQITMMFPMH